jgi:hypothetical protein
METNFAATADQMLLVLPVGTAAAAGSPLSCQGRRALSRQPIDLRSVGIEKLG